MKQITIYDLLPLLKSGYVAMNKDKSWTWFNDCPVRGYHIANYVPTYWYGRIGTQETSLCCFNIAPFEGSWEDSLIKVEHSKKKSTDRKDFDDFIEQHSVSPWGFLTEAILKEDFECWKKRRKND